MSDSSPTPPPPDSSSTPPGGNATTTEQPKPKGKDPLRGSTASGVWIGVVAFAVLLVLLAIFILQNTGSTEISFLGWTGSAPLAAMLLIASAAGALLVVMAGSLRIIQLRRRVRHERKRSR